MKSLGLELAVVLGCGMRWKFAVLVAAISFLGLNASADTVSYTYTGAPMISAPNALSGGNCATCSINGTMTLDSPLLPTPILIGASEPVTPSSFKFTATGLGILNDHNSTLTMYVSVQPSGDIYSFFFNITGPMGFIYSNFYGSAFEFTDYYYGPNGKKTVAAQGNYTGNPWTMSASAAKLSANISTGSDPVSTPEPTSLSLLFVIFCCALITRTPFAARPFVRRT